MSETGPIASGPSMGSALGRASRRGHLAVIGLTLVLLVSAFVGLMGAVGNAPAIAPFHPIAIAPTSVAPAPARGSTPVPLVMSTPVGSPSTSSGSPTTLPNPFLRTISPVYTPVSVGGRLSSLPGTLRAPSPLPAGGSTGSNWYVMGESLVGGLQQLGGSNQSLVESGYDFGTLYNTSTGFFSSHGVVGVSVSKDGGATWKTSWPAQNTSWSTVGNKDYGDVLSGAFILAFYYEDVRSEVTDSFPAVAGNATGKSIAMIAPYDPACFYTGCTTAAQYNASSGVAIVHSGDGGTTWSRPMPLTTNQWDWVAAWPGGCGVNSGLYLVPGRQTTSVAMSANPANDHFYAAWTTTDWYYPLGHGSGLLYCNTTTSTPTLEYGWAAPGGGMFYNMSISTSGNGGATWGTPKLAAKQFFPIWQGIPYAPAVANPSLTIGPSPSYPVTLVYSDLLNLSAAGLVPIGEITSTNNGTSWNAPFDTGIQANVMHYSAPNWFYNYTAPVIATDNWSGSSHVGHQYMVWNDNRTTTAGQGYPSIAFSVNTTASGASWSSPRFLSLNNPGTTRYFMPTIAVQPNGRIWVAYYGSNVNNGNYRTYGVFSDDGGTTWSDQFVISDATSTPGATPSSTYTAATPEIAATSAGAYVAWADCRAIDCTSRGNTTTFGALVNPVKITTNAVGLVNVTVSVSGFPSTYGVTGPTGSAVLAVDWNASITISVPSQFPAPNGSYIESFKGFTGALTSASNPATFNYRGGDIGVTYQNIPGAWIVGTISPILAGTLVRIQGPSGSPLVPAVTVKGLANYFNQTVAGGLAYYVNISAPKYNLSTQLVPTVVLKESDLSITLGKVIGWIAGRVSPTNAQVVVNDTAGGAPGYPTVNAASGHFNVSRVWGQYWVNASLPGYKSCDQLVTVFPGQTNASAPINPCVLWGSHLTGTVQPINANLTIGSSAVTLMAGGYYNQSLPAGNYDVKAHLFGYSTFEQLIGVPLGVNKTLDIKLTNHGWINGSVLPSTAVLLVNLQPQTVVNGKFNITELGSTSTQAFVSYSVTAKALGYDSQTRVLNVTPGNVTYINFQLNKTNTSQPPTYCQQHPTAANCTTGGGQQPQNNNLLLYVGIGVIVVLVVAIALVLLLRRGGRGGAAGSPPPEEAPSEPPMEDAGGTPPP